MKKENKELILKKAFHKIFRNKDPFGKMFNDTIRQKIVLYPTNGYHLNEKQFYSLMNASKALGEKTFYLYTTEIENNNKKDNYIFEYGELSNEISYEEYKKLKIVLENALYSTLGNWGAIISHENHAVVGGTDYFIELLKNSYPLWKEDLKNFIKMCENSKKEYGSNLNWLPDFLSYIG